MPFPNSSCYHEGFHCIAVERQISPDESVFEVRKRWGDRGNEEVRLQLKQMSLSKQSANRAKGIVIVSDIN